MALLDALRRNDSGERRLREELKRERWQVEHLTESMQVLEQQLVDEGWRRLVTQLDREFTRDGLDDLMRISRAMYLSHPLIQRAVNVRAYYTWAQGVHYQAAAEKVQEEVVQPLIEDDGNRAQLFGHQARILTDTDQSVDGNTFHALFTTDAGDISVRAVPAEEIRDIHTKPGDKGELWFYRRVWSEREFNVNTGGIEVKQHEVLYPDIHHPALRDGGRMPDSIGGTEVRWDAPIIHQRTGGLRQMMFGMPETYAALDWARAYRKFLEDWHTIVASLARFAWRMTVKGSKVKTAKERLSSTITPDHPDETNPPPSAGSVFVGTGDQEMTPIPKTGANTSAEDAKPARLMIAAAMDLPDTILSGDPQQGNLATAKSLDRPTELAIRSRQSMWADHDRDIFAYATWARYRGGGGLARDVDASVSVSFPSVLEHDVEMMVKAIVAAATLDGKLEAGTIPREQLAKMLLQALNVEDIEAVLDDLEPEEEEALQQAVERLGRA